MMKMNKIWIVIMNNKVNIIENDNNEMNKIMNILIMNNEINENNINEIMKEYNNVIIIMIIMIIMKWYEINNNNNNGENEMKMVNNEMCNEMIMK